MNPKRILLFCPWAYSTSYYTTQFCNVLALGQNRVILIAPRNFFSALLSEKVEQVNWPYVSPIRTNISSILQTPSQVFRFIMIIRKYRPHWIHILWKHHLPLILKPYLKPYKLGFTVHDPVLHSGESGFLRFWVQRQLIEMSDVVFVHGEKNKQNLMQDYELRKKKIVKILHGNLIFKNYNTKIPQEKMILFFGRLKKYKGLDLLLKSFKMVSPCLSGYRLVIRGQGKLTNLPANIISTPNVDIDNRFVPHDELPELFGRALFLVLPYLEGTQSGVVSTAFAFGRTCIVSSVGGIPEVVKNNENGLLVPPGDVDALAKAILRLVNDSNFREKLEKGALQTFTNTHMNYKKNTCKIVTDAFCGN